MNLTVPFPLKLHLNPICEFNSTCLIILRDKYSTVFIFAQYEYNCTLKTEKLINIKHYMSFSSCCYVDEHGAIAWRGSIHRWTPRTPPSTPWTLWDS